MKLIDYMRSHSMRPEDIAERIGEVSSSGVRKWMSGERIPRRDQMERLAVVTKGAVLPNDFFDISPAAALVACGPDADPSGPAFCQEAAE